MATPPRKWTDADDRTLAALHGEGLGLNEIAKKMGRANASVSRYAARAGLSFDRTATAKATNAAVVDAKARQVRLEHDLMSDVELVRQKVGEVETFRDMLAFGQGLDAAVRAYTNFKKSVPDDGGADLAKSMLGRILLAVEISLVGQDAPLLNPVGMVDLETGDVVVVHTWAEWWEMRRRQVQVEIREPNAVAPAKGRKA
jgi:hypothetical protein